MRVRRGLLPVESISNGGSGAEPPVTKIIIFFSWCECMYVKLTLIIYKTLDKIKSILQSLQCKLYLQVSTMEIVRKFYYQGKYLTLDEVRDLHDSLGKYLWELPKSLAELYLLYAYGICGYARYYRSFLTRKYPISICNDIVTACNDYKAYDSVIPFFDECLQLKLF